MERIGTFAIATHAANADICAAVRLTRWLPGVIWSDIAKSHIAIFTVRYDDKKTTRETIITVLQEKGYRCVILTAFSLSLLPTLHCPFIRLARHFRLSQECRYRVQLQPCPVCGNY
jgi:hypothetical protein